MNSFVLAQLNIATLLYPLEAVETQDFADNLDRINQLAEHSAGFVWRLETSESSDAAAIQYFGANVIVNMSTWSDIDSLHNFVYKSTHSDFLRRRKEWFSQMKTYSVMWWQDKNTEPTIEQAYKKLHQLENNGPTAEAFTFNKNWPNPSNLGD